jgi:hypothetical protein
MKKELGGTGNPALLDLTTTPEYKFWSGYVEVGVNRSYSGFGSAHALFVS